MAHLSRPLRIAYRAAANAAIAYRLTHHDSTLSGGVSWAATGVQRLRAGFAGVLLIAPLALRRDLLKQKRYGRDFVFQVHSRSYLLGQNHDPMVQGHIALKNRAKTRF